MNLWKHDDSPPHPSIDVLTRDSCLFCRHGLETVFNEELGFNDLWLEENFREVRLCQRCGWWTAREADSSDDGWAVGASFSGAYGALKTLDLADINLPLAAVRDYLAARYDQRKSLNPRRFEEVVGSVFGDLGYRSTVTAYRNDGGIDVILEREGEEAIGVQVKTQQGRVSAEQIRALTGALVVGGFTRGMFVTTSEYQRGAWRTSEESAARGYPIELLNAEAFLQALGIAQLQVNRLTPDLIQTCLSHLAVIRSESRTHFGGSATS